MEEEFDYTEDITDDSTNDECFCPIAPDGICYISEQDCSRCKAAQEWEILR